MPTVIRKTETVTLTDKRKEVSRTVGWQVTSLWSPPTDVYETEAEYVVKVEIAGIQDTDLEISFENGILNVSGVRPDVTERRAYHQMEIHFGKFSTSIGIPGPVDLDSSVAEYKDGILSVRMPKAKATNIRVEG
ncbi:MAG TPA: Hsp20/alpha crystallin family protein [Anaerolineales bacterium]|nr:Hsp20/alpha crystallin family protein [Anaerolineales bacterium]